MEFTRKIIIFNNTENNLHKWKDRTSFYITTWGFPLIIKPQETVEVSIDISYEGSRPTDFGFCEYKNPSRLGDLNISVNLDSCFIKTTGNVTSTPDDEVEYDSNESIAIRLS